MKELWGGAAGKGKNPADKSGVVTNTTKGNWMLSLVSNLQLEGLATLGYIPRRAQVSWRLPVKNELAAAPRPGERVHGVSV
jgi:hypothetical protein